MTQDGIRTRRNFPAETWAVIRDAYLGGETAESISRRLNISINTIRKRATRCGWTHAAHARAIHRASEEGLPARIDLKQARDAAIAHAAALLGEGRALEASAILRAAEALGRVTGAPAPAPADADVDPEDQTPEERAEAEAEKLAVVEAVMAEVERRANVLALDLLTDRGPSLAAHGAFALRWRARMLGPDVALADFQAGVHGGWASRHWDAHGRLLPVDPRPPEPDTMMVRQHLRHCQGADWGKEDLSGWTWPPRDWLPEDQRPPEPGAGADEAAVAGEGVVDVTEGPRVWRL